MKLYKVDAVVLSSREMREADRVLVLFSRQLGKLRVVAHGVNKPSSRKRGAVQPFCYSSFLIYKGKDLDSIRQCEEIETFPGLRTSLETLSYASYFSELIDAIVMEGEINTEVFSLLLITLNLLSQNNHDVELLARAFELRLMDLSGFRPQLEECANCGINIKSYSIAFSNSSGGIVCSRCSISTMGVKYYQPGIIETLKLLLSWNMQKLQRIKISPTAKKHLKTLMQEYVGYYAEKKFKSMSFLEKMHAYNKNV